MEVIDLKCSKYIDEYIELCSLEWGEKKTKYRNKGYSKILNNAILKKAKELGY